MASRRKKQLTPDPGDVALAEAASDMLEATVGAMLGEAPPLVVSMLVINALAVQLSKSGQSKKEIRDVIFMGTELTMKAVNGLELPDLPPL